MSAKGWPEINFRAPQFCLKTLGQLQLFVYIQGFTMVQRSWMWMHAHMLIQGSVIICILSAFSVHSFSEYLGNTYVVCVTSTWSGSPVVSLEFMVEMCANKLSVGQGEWSVSDLDCSQLCEHCFEDLVGSIVGLIVHRSEVKDVRAFIFLHLTLF